MLHMSKSALDGGKSVETMLGWVVGLARRRKHALHMSESDWMARMGRSPAQLQPRQPSLPCSQPDCLPHSTTTNRQLCRLPPAQVPQRQPSPPWISLLQMLQVQEKAGACGGTSKGQAQVRLPGRTSV